MKVIEYGTENSEVIMLMHGGGLSWWSYREAAEFLARDYHVILPILHGHAGSGQDFVSMEETAKDIIEYIDKHYSGSVLFIGGLSLGGQILVEILSQRSDICKAAIIESALVIPMKLTHYLVKPMMDMSYGLIKQKWFAKLQFQSLRIKVELYEEYYRDTCEISKENMTSFLKANSWYEADEKIGDTKAKVSIIVGGKEQGVMIRSAKKLHEMIPGSELEIKDGLYHGEYSINYAKEYADRVKKIIEESRGK